MSIRDRHTYIIGKSGSGKTNLIRTMILQDLAYGNGVGVLAPELELLTEEILPYIPEDRIDDVVFVNPVDTDCPVPFNPLHVDADEDIDLKVDDAVTIFKRLMGDTGAQDGRDTSTIPLRAYGATRFNAYRYRISLKQTG